MGLPQAKLLDTPLDGCNVEAVLLCGKTVAESVYQSILERRQSLLVKPKLSVLLVGTDPASQTYVRSKAKKCSELGFEGEVLQFPENVAELAVFEKIDVLNSDPSVHGILVQLPLPPQLDSLQVIQRLNPLKDVDGLHPQNVGLLVQGTANFLPCTPAGIMEMLRFHSIDVSGKKAVVLGRSEIVGKPMAQLLLQQNATVTICHSKTVELKKEASSADILIAAVGRPHFVTAEMVKPGAVVIDVGIHRVDGKLVGDVDRASVEPKVAALSPVPGGVGPMTIAMLMRNVLKAAELQSK